MKNVIEYIVKNLVTSPENVKVTERVDGNLVNIHISVLDADLGKVIGKNGKVATAIRTLARSLARTNNQKVTIKIGE